MVHCKITFPDEILAGTVNFTAISHGFQKVISCHSSSFLSQPCYCCNSTEHARVFHQIKGTLFVSRRLKKWLQISLTGSGNCAKSAQVHLQTSLTALDTDVEQTFSTGYMIIGRFKRKCPNMKITISL